MRRKARFGNDFQLEDRITPAAAADFDAGFGGTGQVVIPVGITSFSFSNSLGATSAATTPDGKIILAGSAEFNTTSGQDFAAVKLNDDGTLDTSFGTSGIARVPFDLYGFSGFFNEDTAFAVAVQADGKIVLAGRVRTSGFNYDMGVARLNADGTLDSTFGTGGKTTVEFVTSPFFGGSEDEAHAMLIEPNGKIVLAGFTDNDRFDDDFAAVRLNSDGKLDSTFGTNGKTSIAFNSGSGFGQDADQAFAIARQADGKFVLAGSVELGNFFDTDFGMARLNANGTLDTTFGASGLTTVPFDLFGANSDVARAIAIQGDGKIVVAGSAATRFGFYTDFAITRLNTNGLLDASFGINGLTVIPFDLAGGLDDIATGLIVAPDGKIFVTGSAERGFSFGTIDFALARLTTDGNLDDTFGFGGKITTGLGSAVSQTTGGQAVVRQADGKIVLVGGAQGAFTAVRIFGVDPPPPPPESPEPPEPLFPPFFDIYKSLPPSLAGGRADGKARILAPRGGGYVNRGTVDFFPGVAVTVRTAVADVNGDGVPDYIGGTGPGTSNRVTIIDGASFQPLASWIPFEESFTGGVFVAAADLNGDGTAEVIVSPDEGGGPLVAVFDGFGIQIARFYGINDEQFRGGARVAVGDINGDGTPDIIVSAGFLGGARIAIYNGKDVAAGAGLPRQLVTDFFAFEDGLRNGTYVAAGDVNKDGYDDLAIGGGPDGAPRVRLVSGKQLLSVGSFAALDEVANSVQISNFFVGDKKLRGGVRVALRDVDADRRADLITGSGDGEDSRVRIYKAQNLVSNKTDNPYQELDPFAVNLPDGVYVG